MRALRSVVGLVLFGATASLGVASDNAPSCGDFLAQLAKKPKYLEYTGCKHNEGGQQEEWVAQYRVPGAHAAEVEAFFVKQFRMTPLKKSCCQWDGASGSYVQQSDRLFGVEMTSEEDNQKTASRSRSIWPKIGFFYVQVSLTTSSP
jgi:hypothetical protein